MEYGPHLSPSAYRPETVHLQSDNLAQSASIQRADIRTQYPELARSEAAQYAQGYIHGSNEQCWEALTRHQRQDRLTLGTYYELASLSRMAMPDVATYQAVDYVNAVHDDFKNLGLAPKVGLAHGANHDEALRRLFLPEYQGVRQAEFPSLESGEFSQEQLALIEGVLQGDFIRFVQSQASQEEVDKLAQMPRPVLLATVMHGVHDMGGAMGHRQPATSLTLDEPATTRILDAAHALLATPEELGLPADFPMDGFSRQYLYRYLRAARLGITDDPSNPDLELQTKLTIADLLRSYTAKEFAVPLAAYQRLPDVLRQSWALTQSLPLQYPHVQEPELKGLGTEYAPAFLRSFGKDEDALVLAMASFAQIQLHAKNVPFDIAIAAQGEWPPRFPYDKINFYHIANALKENPPVMNKPVWLEYTIKNDLLTPRIVAPRHRGRHVKQLFHPDAFRIKEEQ